MENTTLALKSVLCNDVNLYIQHIVNMQRRMDLHVEYFKTLVKFIERKIDIIDMEMEDNVLSEYGMCDYRKIHKMNALSFLLDDAYYNSKKKANSTYRPRGWTEN